MPLVEIIKTNKTSSQVVQSLFEFTKKLGKIPILVKDSPGFVVNRLLIPYMLEALWLLKDGKKIDQVDFIFTHQFGFPMGPFRLMDEVGLDICINVIEVFKNSGFNIEVPEFTKNLISVLGLGKKSHKGFYIYDKKKQKVNPKVYDFASSQVSNLVTDEVAFQRGMYLLINEALKVLQEKVVETSRDLDLAMIFGTGFPPFQGGPITYAKKIGFKEIQLSLRKFEEQWGSRFKASSYFENFIN